MSDKLKFKWTANDGYLGGGRPQSTFIPVDEITEAADEVEAMQIVSDAIQADFEQRVSADYNENDALEIIRRARKATT